MNKFVRYYNQNRRELFIIVIIILFAIFLLKFINFKIAKNKEKNQENIVAITENVTTQYDENINTYQVTTGTKNNFTAENDINYIVKFIQYCNEGNINEAYQMISDECKEEVFPSLEYFKQLYYDNNFNTNKSYDIQNWASAVYKVDLKDNMLHAGKTNMNNIQDFITVIKIQNEYKLNINNFIGKTSLNKTNNIENMDIEIISKSTFMSYEIYNLKIKNYNDFTIFLDDLNKTDTIYLTDENGIKYVAYLHELTKEQLKINPYSSIEIKIKFTNGYIVGREIKKITFSNVIFDKEEQETTQIAIKLK